VVRNLKELAPLFSPAASPFSSNKAQDSGFSFGAEFGVTNFQMEEPVYSMYIMPMLNYKGLLVGDSMEFQANLGVPFSFSPEFRLGIDIDINLVYNISPLSLIVNNRLALPVIKSWTIYSPLFGFWYFEANDFFIPKVKYDFFFNTGTLYLQTNLLIHFLPDAFEYIGMHFSLGWKGENGLGLEIKNYNHLKPEVKFFQYLDLLVSYDKGSFFGEIIVSIPTFEDGINFIGIEVTPKVELKFTNGFKAYASLPIRNVGSDWYEVNNGLSIGIKKSF